DESNYNYLIVRVSAAEVTPGAGGSVNVQGFVQRNNFSFAAAGATLPLPLDGQFHDLVFPLAGITNLTNVDTTGINLRQHATDLVINVDLIRLSATVPEPASITLCGFAVAGCLGMIWRKRRQR